MTIQKRHFASSGLVTALWLSAVTWGAPLVHQYPLTATRLSVILVTGAIAFMLYYRSKTTDTNEKKLVGRMLVYTAAGVLVSLASAWA